MTLKWTYTCPDNIIMIFVSSVNNTNVKSLRSVKDSLNCFLREWIRSKLQTVKSVYLNGGK